MAKQSNQRPSYKTSYRGFEGVNLRKTHSGDESITLIENFRITDDKSLKKRCGFTKSCEAALPISTFFRTVIDGYETYYLLCHNLILMYTPHNDTITPIFSLNHFTSAYFFEYLGSIYLCTDQKIYEITSNDRVVEFKPYIPLYGKDWPSSTPGEINEPINILSDKVIISYKFVTPSHGYLSIGDLNFSSIDAIYRNGELLSTDAYYYDEEYNLIALLEHEDNDEFIAIISIRPDQATLTEREEVLKTKASSVFYELNNHSLLLWGNPSNNKIYYSKTVDSTTYDLVLKVAPNTSALYIPTNSFFTVDKHSDRVNSIIRHYDRVLIMTESSTWMTDLSQLGQKDFQLKSINASLGCSKLGGTVRINNNIISLGENAAFCWTSNTDELNECNAYSISENIQELLPTDFFKNCIITLNHQDSEIWFHNPNEEYTWIYNTKQNAWYKYRGFLADIFLESTKYVIFSKGKEIFRFDKSFQKDYLSTIDATFKSGDLEFNTLKYKKFNLIVLRGEFTSGKLSLTLTLDHNKTLTKEIELPKEHSILAFRIRTGSFKTISVELSASGEGNQILHSMELYAN